MKLNVLVVGAGAFGTALAWCAHRAGHRVALGCKTEDEKIRLAATRVHPLFPHQTLPSTWTFHTNIEAVLADFDIVVLAVPTQQIVPFFHRYIAAVCQVNIPWLVACKGLEQNTGKLVTEMISSCVVRDTLGRSLSIPAELIGLISGPNMARDLVDSVPSWISLWMADERYAGLASFVLAHETLQVTLCHDPVTLQATSSLKNVYAIMMGLCMHQGHNMRAALFQASWLEMSFLVELWGGQPSLMLHNVFGLGDFFLTAGGSMSRNVQFGEKLAQGHRWADLVTHPPLAEGAFTLLAAWKRLEAICPEACEHVPLMKMLHHCVRDGFDHGVLIQALTVALSAQHQATLKNIIALHRHSVF